MKMTNELKWKLQLFAEDPNEPGGDPKEPDGNPKDTDGDPKDTDGDDGEKKYTDAQVDAIIEKKFAKWQKQQDKKISEAERLANMTAEEKADSRMEALEAKIAEYEKERVRGDMATTARGILVDKGINISDQMLGNLIADDADTTKANVDEFVALFQSEVGKAVKDALKGATPKTGEKSTITKKQILDIKDRNERQKKIRENINLFK